MAGLMHTVVKLWPLFTPSGSCSWGMVLYCRIKKERKKKSITNSAGEVDWKGGLARSDGKHVVYIPLGQSPYTRAGPFWDFRFSPVHKRRDLCVSPPEF